MKLPLYALTVASASLISGCGGLDSSQSTPPLPREIVDLGALVTEDLPERVWGEALLADRGWYERQNSFDVLQWSQDLAEGTVHGSNSYYTLFNHGGPHVDAPNHVGIGEDGVDSYPLDAFVGPLTAAE